MQRAVARPSSECALPLRPLRPLPPEPALLLLLLHLPACQTVSMDACPPGLLLRSCRRGAGPAAAHANHALLHAFRVACSQTVTLQLLLSWQRWQQRDPVPSSLRQLSCLLCGLPLH